MCKYFDPNFHNLPTNLPQCDCDDWEVQTFRFDTGFPTRGQSQRCSCSAATSSCIIQCYCTLGFSSAASPILVILLMNWRYKIHESHSYTMTWNAGELSIPWSSQQSSEPWTHCVTPKQRAAVVSSNEQVLQGPSNFSPWSLQSLKPTFWILTLCTKAKCCLNSQLGYGSGFAFTQFLKDSPTMAKI